MHCKDGHQAAESRPHCSGGPLLLRLQAEEAQLQRMTKSLLDPSKIMLKDKMAFVIGGGLAAVLPALTLVKPCLLVPWLPALSI